MGTHRCHCPQPIESPNPRSAGQCARCGRPIGEEILSTDRTVREFFDRLESSFPGSPPATFHAFRAQCEARERDGRDTFGLSYLHRSNLEEAKEEGTDGANYFLFDTLQHRRLAGNDDDMVLALQGAWHAYKLHECASRLAARRRSS